MFSDTHDRSEYTTYMNTHQQVNDPVFDSDPWANSQTRNPQIHNSQTHNAQVHNPHPYRPIRSTSRERHLQDNFDAIAGMQGALDRMTVNPQRPDVPHQIEWWNRQNAGTQQSQPEQQLRQAHYMTSWGQTYTPCLRQYNNDNSTTTTTRNKPQPNIMGRILCTDSSHPTHIGRSQRPTYLLATDDTRPGGT